MTLTPAMQQYYDMKKQCSDAILFFRMWDFYEMFDDDAMIAHKVLGINITSRNKNADTPIPLAGIPYHALWKYLPLLVNAWYKVAISEQVSDPTLKWIVKREIVRIVTPATLDLEWEQYKSEDSSYIYWLIKLWDTYAISSLETHTNCWQTGEFSSFWELATEMYKMSPKEVVVSKNLFNDLELKEILKKKYNLNIYYFTEPKKPKEVLLNHFWTTNLAGFWIENKPSCISAAAILFEYIGQNQKVELDHLKSLSYMSFDWFLELDESTIKNLDLLYNFSTNSHSIGTLFWILDNTKTSMGKRLLRENIVRPSRDINYIQNRHDIIEQFLNDPVLLDAIIEKLKYVSDLDAIMTRLSLWRSGPRDLLNLKRSLQSILDVQEIITASWNTKLINMFNL